jgi:hypothetical protein
MLYGVWKMGVEGELDRKISLISQEWEKQDSRKSNEHKSVRIILDKIYGAIQIDGIQENPQIEEDISDSIFHESNYCIMITKKSKEVPNIGNIYLISENKEPEKTLVIIEKLYSKGIMHSEPVDTSNDLKMQIEKKFDFPRQMIFDFLHHGTKFHK